MLKRWNVYVFRQGRQRYVCEVSERTESLARCAALHRFGIGDDPSERAEAGDLNDAIGPEEAFEVSPQG